MGNEVTNDLSVVARPVHAPPRPGNGFSFTIHRLSIIIQVMAINVPLHKCVFCARQASTLVGVCDCELDICVFLSARVLLVYPGNAARLAG